MNIGDNKDKSQELYNSIIKKAWKDENFKNELLSNPLKTIEGFTGFCLRLPYGKKLIVVDQTNPSFIYLNIPKKIDIHNHELSEDQLEKVSAGEIIIPQLNIPDIYKYLK